MPPLPPPPPKLRCRSGSAARFWGGGSPPILGETPPKPQIRAPPAGKTPKFGIGTGLRAEPPLPFLGGGGILGVPPAPILGSPNLGVPLEPPLAAAIAAATRQDEDGDTPLHIAVAQGAVAVARRLVALFLRGGRDLDVYNHLRQTPLHLAVITGQVALVRLLVAHGASPMAPDRLGRTCAHLACGSHLPGGGASAGPRPRVLRELLRGPAPPAGPAGARLRG
ncbi:B-cell lymphoma 3 protein-like, partial [Anomalospiza imberbis]|uniref:B-cell lymphoma 3 protein-like n=1 Tax=Anomalospiza imberbis TaxID=187417 RepID=UPI00358FAFDF